MKSPPGYSYPDERTAHSGDGFTGVWRVRREYNADQQRVADEIIIGPIPGEKASGQRRHPQPPITLELPPQPAD
ncbi:hypothetical protein KCP75_07695 [Salmonella enterica subsp. enterica]|nr:hypothetical protein KCP75_07695 [Salmonella enterica subsp. enterica]